jgi:4-aminobutyrate aminotransferase/(S)-3-amino-2-methylpropionate transaminase
VLSGQDLPLVSIPPPGPRSRELALRLSAVESPAFEARREARAEASGAEQAPIVYASARGSNVLDADGNRYVDLTAGFGALLLGHAPNPATLAAAEASSDLALALGDVYASEPKVEAAEAVCALFPEPGARVMFGLSGADAVTCALKTAALATNKPRVVAFEGAYHGLSHGPLAACGFSRSFREPFANQLGVQVSFAPYPSSPSDLEASLGAVREAIRGGDVAAVLVEPILGRGGCVVPPASFLPALRSMCDEAGALLVADEVWSGMGRTGALLACHHSGVVPDVLCLGKGLGGGVPISACIGRGRVMQAWAAHGGSIIHTGTHFGSPPACAALLATLDALKKDDLPARAADLGERLVQDLVSRGVRARGRGLMIGVELDDAGKALAVARALLASGYIVLTGGTKGNVLTLSPPLTIAPELLAAFAEACADAVRHA